LSARHGALSDADKIALIENLNQIMPLGDAGLADWKAAEVLFEKLTAPSTDNAAELAAFNAGFDAGRLPNLKAIDAARHFLWTAAAPAPTGVLSFHLRTGAENASLLAAQVALAYNQNRPLPPVALVFDLGDAETLRQTFTDAVAQNLGRALPALDDEERRLLAARTLAQAIVVDAATSALIKDAASGLFVPELLHTFVAQEAAAQWKLPAQFPLAIMTKRPDLWQKPDAASAIALIYEALPGVGLVLDSVTQQILSLKETDNDA
jgi:hypothetical protein